MNTKYQPTWSIPPPLLYPYFHLGITTNLDIRRVKLQRLGGIRNRKPMRLEFDICLSQHCDQHLAQS